MRVWHGKIFLILPTQRQLEVRGCRSRAVHARWQNSRVEIWSLVGSRTGWDRTSPLPRTRGARHLVSQMNLAAGFLLEKVGSLRADRKSVDFCISCHQDVRTSFRPPNGVTSSGGGGLGVPGGDQRDDCSSRALRILNPKPNKSVRKEYSKYVERGG